MEEEAQDSPTFRWYALQTLSGQEARVKKAIENRAAASGVSDHIRTVLFPTENVSEIKNGKKQVRARKLYPGYLFLEVSLYDAEGKLNQRLWQFVRGIVGVSGFVGGDSPVALKQAEVDEILFQLDAKAGKVAPKVSYGPGDLVKITDGPFEGSVGEVSDVDLERGILRISVGLFGRTTPVELEFWQVEREKV